MFDNLPKGFELYMERSKAPRLGSIVHRVDGLFDVFAPMAQMCRKGINQHHLLNYYDKYFVPYPVKCEDKYPLEVLFAAKGAHIGLCIADILDLLEEEKEAQEKRRILEMIPMLPRIEVKYWNPGMKTATIFWDETARFPLQIIDEYGVTKDFDRFCSEEFPKAVEKYTSIMEAHLPLLTRFYYKHMPLDMILSTWDVERIKALAVPVQTKAPAAVLASLMDRTAVITKELAILASIDKELENLRRLEALLAKQKEEAADVSRRTAAATQQLKELDTIRDQVMELRRLEAQIAQAKRILEEPECA